VGKYASWYTYARTKGILDMTNETEKENPPDETLPKDRWVKNAFFSPNPPATKNLRLDELHNLVNRNHDGVNDTTDYELAEMILERANLKEHVRYNEIAQGLADFFSSVPEPAMQWINPNFQDKSLLTPKLEVRTRGIKKEGSKFTVKVSEAPENAKGTIKLHHDVPGGTKVQEWVFETDHNGSYSTTLLVNPLKPGRHYFAIYVGALPFDNSYFEVKDSDGN
jgi:hypothetical protein